MKLERKLLHYKLFRRRKTPTLEEEENIQYDSLKTKVDLYFHHKRCKLNLNIRNIFGLEPFFPFHKVNELCKIYKMKGNFSLTFIHGYAS